jgi:hypothetical protein
MKLNCNICPQNQNDYCTKLKQILVNGYAKQFFGGIIDNAKFKGICRVAQA